MPKPNKISSLTELKDLHGKDGVLMSDLINKGFSDISDKMQNWIDVWIEYNEEMFKIILQDYGTGFEGFSEKQYDVMSAMDGRQTGGFGLYIISRSMNEIDYRPDPKRGNRLTLIKYLPQITN